MEGALLGPTTNHRISQGERDDTGTAACVEHTEARPQERRCEKLAAPGDSQKKRMKRPEGQAFGAGFGRSETTSGSECRSSCACMGAAECDMTAKPRVLFSARTTRREAKSRRALRKYAGHRFKGDQRGP